MLFLNNTDNTNYKQYLLDILNPTDKRIELLATIENPEFPGAIVVTKNNYIIGASSQKDWSILASLVKSFLGVSFSNYTGLKNELSTLVAEEKYLLDHNIIFASSIAIPDDKEAQLKAEEAFLKLYRTYNYSPNKSVQTSEYIDSVLERFISALQINDIDTAQQIITQIKNENRLDALNIQFMKIELSYSINDWNSIVNHPLITQIINSRKPLKIRLHIIEAFYYEFLSLIENEDLLLDEYKHSIRAKISNLLFHCPSNASSEIKTVFLLAYLNDDIKKNEIDKIYQSIKTLPKNIQDSINKKIETETEEQSTHKTKNDYIEARASLIDANNTGTIESIANSKIKIHSLSKLEQLELIKEDVNDQLNVIPLNWLEWLKLLLDESFTDARQFAEQALEEWPIDEFLRDTSDIKTLSSTIELIEEDFTVQRFIHSLPILLESFRRSEHFPNPMFLPIYTSILEVITIHEVKDVNTLVVSQDIVETVLSFAPKEEQYNYILGMVETIVDKTNGKSFINWLLDYAELLISENASNITVRNKLLEKLLLNVYSYKDWLEEFHLKLILKLANNIGIEELFKNIIFEQDKIVENPWDKYTGKTIGIYTLSENAARHAKEYLEEQIDNIKVILNHDKAATDALRNLAHSSDYVVLVTQSAKHAATGEIQKILRQKDRDPLFPIGKGSSSIISALLKD